ncbi:MAG TPA: glycosyl transferase family protein [Thiomicrospira sp.]|nr:glycosyl transferase family protein [Thiomicrospira sp.]
MADHPFSEYLRILGKGPKGRRTLTQKEAEQAMKMVLAEEVTDRQVGAFLLLIRANGETQDELKGFVSAIRAKFIVKTSTDNIDLDFSAYAGKWRYPPYFLLAIKLLVNYGYKVLLHGDSGQFANRKYIDLFLTELGYKQAKSIADAKKLVAQSKLVYLPLQNFAPQLRNILHLKEELGVRTIFNTAVKLLNPLNANNCIQGIYHKGVENLHHGASSLNGTQKNLVFKGEGGEPEIRPDALTHLYFSDHLSDQFQDVTLPAIIDRNARPKEWKVEDVLNLWQGKSSDLYGKHAVIATTAVALMLLENITIEPSLVKARQLWEARDCE